MLPTYLPLPQTPENQHTVTFRHCKAHHSYLPRKEARKPFLTHYFISSKPCGGGKCGKEKVQRHVARRDSYRPSNFFFLSLRFLLLQYPCKLSQTCRKFGTGEAVRMLLPYVP
jgi:hypothetical protein